jgi:hypothetical protein
MSNAKTHSPSEPSGASEAHESSELDLRPILRFAGLLVVLCVVVFFAMRWMFVTENEEGLAADAPLPPLATARQVPPDPRLQSLPGVPLVGESMPDGEDPFMSTSFADFQRKQNEALSSYGWVDRQAGIVHIPIDRAIELTLEKGLPTAAPKSRKQ